MERINDGLPETLEEVVSYYRGRYYKLKVARRHQGRSRSPDRIAFVLDHRLPEIPHARSTATSSTRTSKASSSCGARSARRRRWHGSCKSTLFIEQPIKRSVALSRSVEPLAKLRPVIIDESDGELSSFPTALKLGYSGVSSKNCKGFYKSILNASRVARLGPGYFMSAEDLTTLPGVSVQQDLALVSLLGMTHVERNAHHFVDGMSFASEAEQKAFVVGASRPLRAQGRPSGA